MKFYVSLVAFLLLLPSAVLAAASPVGVWEGTLKTPNGDLGFVFNLHKDGDKWLGEMDVPVQGVSELTVKEVKVEGATVSISLPGPGDPHYEGKVLEDGKTISGNFNQGGATIPMDLKWKSEPRAVSKPQPNSGEVKVLEGVWEGTMDVNGQTLHVRYNFTKNADGSISGTFDVTEQGASGLVVDGITRTGDTVKLGLKVIGGTYEGTLDKDASTITGKFSQGGVDLPLTVHKKKS